MARRFNGTSDFIVFTLPTALQALTAGNVTLVVVANFTDGTDGAMIHTRTSGGTNCWWMETFGNVWNYGSGTTPKNVGAQTNGSWAAYIGRKVTGGANPPRGRKIVYGGATTDTTAGTGLADGTAPGAGGVLQVGKWGTSSEFISADVAAVAVFASDLSDSVTATFTTWADILAASPAWAVHFDQASPTDAITDATGGGGNSSTITGTTIVANPAGFFAGGATVSGAATLSAAPTLTASGTQVAPAAATLTAAPTLSAAATRTTTAAATLSAAPSLSAAAAGVIVSGAASLIAAPTLTSAATRVQPAAATLAAAPTLTSAGARVQPAAATLTASPSLSAAATRLQPAAALLAAAPLLQAAGIATRFASATLSAAPTLSATAGGGPVVPYATAVLTPAALPPASLTPGALAAPSWITGALTPATLSPGNL